MARDDWDMDEQMDDNQTIKSIRDHAKSLERQLKQQERELENLRNLRDTYEQEARRAKAAAVFAQAGLSEKHAALFAAVNPDVEPDEDAVKSFAEEYGLAVKAAEEAEEKLQTDEPGFSPIASGTPGEKKKYSSQEWWDLQRENPAAALLAIRENRVDLATSLADLEKG